MRLTMILAAALQLALTLGVENDDRDVIQTGMLSFFHHENWYAPDWTPKTYVVLYPQYSAVDRPNFVVQLQAIKQNLGYMLKSEMEAVKTVKAEELKSYHAAVARDRKNLAAINAMKIGSGLYALPELVPITQLQFDSRIKVSDKFDRPYRAPEASDGKWTVYARVKRPAFSRDGSYAILEMSIPWSIHSADVTFLMKRSAKGWKRVAVTFQFYV